MRMGQYFHEPCERCSGNVKDKLDLSNCVRKVGLKGATSIDNSTLASKANLAGLKSVKILASFTIFDGHSYKVFCKSIEYIMLV